MDFYVEDRVLDIGVKIVFVAINDIDNHTVNEEWREYREKRIKELLEIYRNIDIHADPILDKATLVDLREPDEVLVSGIEGAINMPFSSFPKGIDEIPKDKPVYVYCREGSFSEEVADILADRGSEIAFQVSSCFQWKGTG